MKTLRLSLTLILGFGSVILALVMFGGQPVRADPDTPCDRYVVIGGNNSWPTNDCSNPNNPCKSIQYALSWAAAGETLCVADRDDIDGPSTYQGTVFITQSVFLDGAWAAHPNELGGGWTFTSTPCNPENVIITGNGTARVISITQASPTIHCFTITGGNAESAEGDARRGGGIAARDAAPIIIGNIITGNYGLKSMAAIDAGRGGGIYMVNVPATAVISGNLIIGNAASDVTWGQGGGIYLENASPQVLANTIRANRAGSLAGDGGGIAVIRSSPLIADNRIEENLASDKTAANGGGISVLASTVVTIERNLIQNNVALRSDPDPTLPSRGGGLYVDSLSAVIRDNQIYGNVASLAGRGLGGGMYLRGLSVTATVAGNIVANGNRASYGANGEGGGVYLDGCSATFMDNRIVQNIASSNAPAYGGGIYVNGGGGLIQSNIITGNQGILVSAGSWGYGGGMVISGSTVLVQDNLIADNKTAEESGAPGAGGGVYAWAGTPKFVRNRLLNNTAGSLGGGFALSGTRPWLEGNTILDNQSTGMPGDGGGGVRIASCHSFTLTNNLIARNASPTGSGVLIAGSGAIRGRAAHNTLAENQSGDGVGVYVGAASKVALDNNLIVSHTVGITNAGATSTITASATLFEGNGLNYGVGITSTNEVAGPAALTSDYHLGNGSNAIGHAITLTWVTQDIDGDPRPLGLPDIGADEVYRRLYLPLVLRNF